MNGVFDPNKFHTISVEPKASRVKKVIEEFPLKPQISKPNGGKVRKHRPITPIVKRQESRGSS